ncbi:hypothetical protein HMPREF0262_00184 [Clostridium sp. ATCC 29733]|nr:hypothetical protein HMPREF0262_00184 [Clostridium sp. ATCC 29733]
MDNFTKERLYNSLIFPETIAIPPTSVVYCKRNKNVFIEGSPSSLQRER